MYALALVLLLVGGRLRVPTTVSLIVTGVLAGPGGFGLVGSEATVTTLAEIGIALLLFMVGLDLSFGEVRRLWRSVTIGGGAQMLGTIAVVAPFAVLWLGPRLETTLFIGFFVAISSTSLIVRELMRRNEIHSPHGSLAIGILLLQDLVALVALVLAPVVFGASGASLGRALLEIVLIAVGLTAATRFLLPLLFRMATDSGREAFGLMVLVASLGTAWLASVLGLSMTIGAFLAGLVIDESEFSHQIHAEIRPLRDLLTSLFFISVGLLVNPAALLPVLPLMLAVAVGIVVLKIVGAAGALLLASIPLRVAVTTAVGLAQIGEFSLVLGASAVANGAIDRASWQVLLGASVLTMMVTPWLVGVAPAFGGWLASRHASDRHPAAETPEELAGHVVILGFGVGGRLIARALHDVQTPCVILELGGVAVREDGRGGLPHPLRRRDGGGASEGGRRRAGGGGGRRAERSRRDRARGAGGTGVERAGAGAGPDPLSPRSRPHAPRRRDGGGGRGARGLTRGGGAAAGAARRSGQHRGGAGRRGACGDVGGERPGHDACRQCRRRRCRTPLARRRSRAIS